MISKKTVLRSAIIAASVAPALALASGYKINEQSASGVGTAYAGRAAVAEDASVVFYNPAAMTELKRAELTVGATYIDATGELSNASKSNAGGAPDSYESATYSEGGDYIPNPTIPFAYYVRPLSDKMAVGLGVFVPFGTNTNYKSDSIVGGFADETTLKVIDIQPSFAYKLNDEISVGGGIDIVYAQALLSKQLDLVPYSPFASTEAQYKGYENKYSVEGDDWAYGWNLAMFWKLSDKTTFGATYRSQIDIEFTGDSEFAQSTGVKAWVDPDGAGGPAPAGAYPVNGGTGVVNAQASKVPLSTPQSVTLSLAHQLTEALQLQAGATWTDWSVFQNLDIIATEDGYIDDLGQLNATADGKYIGHIEENWKDSIAYAVGGTYNLNEQWLVRAGYAYDDAAVTTENRTARVPDNDRQWLTTGFRFTATQDISVDVGVAYLLFHPAKLNERDNKLDGSKKGVSTVQGDYDVDAMALSMQLNYKM